jgi:hypothetical protein
MPTARRRFSGWTVVVPIVLAACIYVVASIIGGTRWTLTGAGQTRTPASLSKSDSAAGRLVPGEPLPGP